MSNRSDLMEIQVFRMKLVKSWNGTLNGCGYKHQVVKLAPPMFCFGIVSLVWEEKKLLKS